MKLKILYLPTNFPKVVLHQYILTIHQALSVMDLLHLAFVYSDFYQKI